MFGTTLHEVVMVGWLETVKFTSLHATTAFPITTISLLSRRISHLSARYKAVRRGLSKVRDIQITAVLLSCLLRVSCAAVVMHTMSRAQHRPQLKLKVITGAAYLDHGVTASGY